jgi:hypothetical protein
MIKVIMSQIWKLVLKLKLKKTLILWKFWQNCKKKILVKRILYEFC